MNDEIFISEGNKYKYYGSIDQGSFVIETSFGENELDGINVTLEIKPTMKLGNRIREAWSILMGHNTFVTLNISRRVFEQIKEKVIENL